MYICIYSNRFIKPLEKLYTKNFSVGAEFMLRIV